jgi:hypothetical protein
MYHTNVTCSAGASKETCAWYCQGRNATHAVVRIFDSQEQHLADVKDPRGCHQPLPVLVHHNQLTEASFTEQNDGTGPLP